MEQIFFNRKTNTDFQEMLNRPIIRNDAKIKKSEQKRLQAKKKRK